VVDSVFELLFEDLNSQDVALLEPFRAQLTCRFKLLAKKKVERRAAKEFTVKETVAEFGLTYAPASISAGEVHFWRIHELRRCDA